MKEGLIKDTYELIIKELQTVVTAFYIVSVGIGMLFNYQKYSEFGINIFDYADVLDFLIAPFADSYILLFVTASFLIVFTLIKLSNFWKRKWPKSYSFLNFGLNKKDWFETYRIILFMMSFLIYLFASADYYGHYTKNKIINKRDITIQLADNEMKSGKLIGKTKDVIFLLNGNKVSAFPISSSVKEIKIQ